MRYNILVVEGSSKRITDFIEFLGFHSLYIVDSAADAEHALKTDMFDYIFLGGALGEEDNGTGIDVAMYIKDNLEYEPEIIVHSWDVITILTIQKILPKSNHVAFGSEEFYSIQIGD